ncbi:MAG: DNA recombination protein RmuC [Saccharofermentans sp.]|nr:DNA recombination protein RmuC [Saccharofermentans sp.]
MEFVILTVSVITLIVSIVICIITVSLNSKSKVDYSDFVTDALEKRISAMEHNLTDVENEQQERTRKHNEEMNGAMRQVNKQGLETINTTLEGNNKLLNSNFENISKALDIRLNNQTETQDKNFRLLREENTKQIESIRELNKKEFESMNNVMGSAMKEDRENNKAMLDNQSKLMTTNFETINKTLETRLKTMTETQDKNFNLLREENNKQIDKIRETVSEKLDKTLNEQFEKSFKGVLTQMTELQKSMGELKGISTQVGSLEKTLNGVKTRGIMGEIQLKQIIADVLTPQQYDTEVATKPNSNDHVEIAIKLPEREGSGFFYLPVDSKCHLDCYETLLEAYDSGNKDAITKAKKAFSDAIKADARTIKEKYVSVPDTTPYAILFVPFEGMYSEIVNLNLLDELNQLQITIAGPYTLLAILSTVTNYYQALAIEKKSHEIEVTLGKVKTEFKKYDEALQKVKNSLESATNNLERLQTTRANAVNRALRSVVELDDGLLPAEIEDDGDE